MLRKQNIPQSTTSMSAETEELGNESQQIQEWI